MKKQTIKKIRRVCGYIALASLLYIVGVVGALEIGTITLAGGIFRTITGLSAFALFSYVAGFWC